MAHGPREIRTGTRPIELSRSTRLGKGGVGEIKGHSFFTNQNEWTWETIRKGPLNAFTVRRRTPFVLAFG